jgi:hypothetical protein
MVMRIRLVLELVWFGELPEPLDELSIERRQGVAKFLGFEQIELHHHLLLPIELMIRSCIGFERRSLEHELLVLELVVDVGRQHLDVLDSFVGRSRQRLLPID